MSEKELNDRFFTDLANLPRDVAYAKDRERRALSAYQDELQGQRKSTIGHLWDEFTGSAESRYQDYRNAPGVVRDAVHRAWTTRDGRAVSSDLVAAGGDYGRQIADRGYGVLGDIHGKGGETLTEGLQLYGEGKTIEFGLGAIGAVGAKRGPKPKGIGPHNLTIERRIEELKRSLGTDWEHVGGGSLKEEYFRTPGGTRSARRMDITFRNSKTGEYYRENVGKTLADGTPLPREVRALGDAEMTKGQRPQFSPYDR